MNEHDYVTGNNVRNINASINQYLGKPPFDKDNINEGGCNYVHFFDGRFIFANTCMCQKHKDYYIVNSTSYNDACNIILVYLLTVLQDMKKKYYIIKTDIPEGTLNLIEYIINKNEQSKTISLQ